MIKILIEGMTEGKGGKESYIINVYRAFDKTRFGFTFVCYDAHVAYEEELVAGGAEVVHLPARHAGPSAHRKALKELLEKGKFDVVWAHKTTLSACEIMELAYTCKVPVRIIHSHSSSNMGGTFTMMMHTLNRRRIRKWATHCFACSDKAAQWFYGDDPAQILRNGIDLERFGFDSSVRARMRQQILQQILGGRKEDLSTVIIGHVGRFGTEKNHRKLIDVFHAFRKTRPDAVLLLCGDGEERGNIERQIRDLGLEDCVVMPGVVDNVQEYLQAMDVMVMPSLFEGLPFSLLEAQAAGLSCVVSDTVSRESDILGWNRFIGLDDPDEVWARAIAEELERGHDRKAGSIGLKAEGFDIEDSVQQIQKMIENSL